MCVGIVMATRGAIMIVYLLPIISIFLHLSINILKTFEQWKDEA
jgi:hypothetical protein